MEDVSSIEAKYRIIWCVDCTTKECWVVDEVGGSIDGKYSIVWCKDCTTRIFCDANIFKEACVSSECYIAIVCSDSTSWAEPSCVEMTAEKYLLSSI